MSNIKKIIAKTNSEENSGNSHNSSLPRIWLVNWNIFQVLELGGQPTIGDCAMILRAAIRAPLPSAFLKILQTTHSLGYVFGRYWILITLSYHDLKVSFSSVLVLGLPWSESFIHYAAAYSAPSLHFWERVSNSIWSAFCESNVKAFLCIILMWCHCFSWCRAWYILFMKYQCIQNHKSLESILKWMS